MENFEQKTNAVKADEICKTLIKQQPIDILIVDDEAIIRTGLSKILAEQQLMHVIGEASSGEESEEMITSLKPHVVLMDISMPGQGGIETTRRILAKNPNIKVLALSVHCDEHYPSQILSAGAQGYITKGVSAQEMIEAITQVSQGNQYICHSVSQKIKDKHLLGRERIFDCLSPEELKVSYQLVFGGNLASISQKLNLTEDTVTQHRLSIFEKLNIESDVALLHLAIRSGLLDKDDKFLN
ncbi:response regulator [Candidatus Synchoanobacter obligatus]|uniref:Response regulator n=1 Tax=Candidatus Synchoanobacter obligatus TaxID=2919597 RepID=A0ABT1L6E0_9GAMM|nr:response regulator [Candidatus Synchoanobacter obligatus]MCP8352443.1 response regulator [Candidatus Synchoanobacter obligatus]